MNKENLKSKLNPKNLFIIGIAIVAISVGVFFSSSHIDLNAQTNMIMNGIIPQCYVYFPDSQNKNPDTAQAIYPQYMVDQINKSGTQLYQNGILFHGDLANSGNDVLKKFYVFPFVRSAAFQNWLFTHCSFYNKTSPQVPHGWDPSNAIPNTIAPPSIYLKAQYQNEENFHNYNILKNKNNYTKIEQIMDDFHMTPQQATDQLFLENALTEKDCKNASWRANSSIYICTWKTSPILINKQTELFLGLWEAPPAPEGLKHTR